MMKIDIVQRVEYIKNICRGKKVLHLGCTNYPYTDSSLKNDDLLHLKLREIADQLYGFDFDQRGLDILAALEIGNLYRADLEHLENLELDQTFDVIVAGEIIEHLSNPGLFLRGIKRFMNPHTKLLITTINAYGGLRFAQYALRGKGGISEPVHPDHISYYSYSTLNLVIKREDLRVEKFLFYDIGPEHRPFLKFYFKWINDLMVGFSRQLADGLIVECVLNNEGN